MHARLHTCIQSTKLRALYVSVSLPCTDLSILTLVNTCRLTGCSPFLGDDDAETLQNISSGEYDFPGADPEEGYDDISDDAKDFISQLLIKNPE